MKGLEMNAFLVVILLATAINGLLAGGSLDTALVKLPARRHIGALAYAAFARGNDLGNGLVVYPVWAISAALLVFLATGLAYLEQQPAALLLPLSMASLTSIIHFFFTSRAAPLMLSLKNTPDDAAVLQGKLDRFTFWHAYRAVFQTLTFFALLWALVSLHA
jgi:hypothetical protein